jgi:hypothetical protein
MKGERMGYINRDGEWVIPPRLLTAHPFQGDVAVVRVRMHNGHGLIDRGGRFRLKPEYDTLLFEEGMFLLAIDLNTEEGDREFGFADASGNIVIPPRYALANRFRDDYAVVSKPSLGTWCVIDRSGAELVCHSDIWIESEYVSEGAVVVNKRDNDGKAKYGLMRVDGEMLIPPRYDLVWPLDNGLARVVRINPEKRRRDPEALGYTETQYKDYAAATAWGDWGLADTSGTEVLPLNYDWIGEFSDGLAEIEKDAAYGYIDPSGALTIPYQFESGRFFLEGRALAKQGGLWGVIDVAGDFIIPPNFEALGDPDPYGSHSWFPEGSMPAKREGKWGFIGESGNWIVPPQYDAVRNFSEGRAAVMRVVPGKPDTSAADAVRKSGVRNRDADPTGEMSAALEEYLGGLVDRFGNNRWGFIDHDGNEIVPCIHLYVRDYKNGLAEAVGEGYLNLSGEFVFRN